ncbi:MAG: hypothetical protein HKP40_12475 [Litoreibacter sp.]|nr:hypothetical protein [Litoreibacter sp.]
MFRKFACLLSFLAVVLVSGCTTTTEGEPQVTRQEQVSELARGIRALGPNVDPEEAERAARIAYEYTGQLAVEYQITDSAIVHNMKVNQGLRPRGLCWHWAEDMETRLKQENFETLELHRAIANASNPFRLEHSTAIVSRRGDTMNEGVVLDPWRYGGELHWAPTLEDTRYNWRPRLEVLEEKRLRRMKRGLERLQG